MQTTATRPLRDADQHRTRRTVVITGQPVPPRRRPPRAQAHIQARPDRIAMWAFALGIFLVFMAVATANASTL
jgi:hypothetical protein